MVFLSIPLSQNLIIEYLKAKNIFLFNDENHCGIDNIYIGNVNTMYKLTNHFFYDLDDILIKNNDIVNQEKLVYRINNILFN